MVKKRNRRTRKNYKKGGKKEEESNDDRMKKCNDTLISQGFPTMKARTKCFNSKGRAHLGLKPSIKDRASALEEQFGDRSKGRKALRTTVGSCRAAVDDVGKYYYNEAGERTESPPGTEEFDKVCNPKDGIEKTGKKVGDCEEARYKGGPAYLYHPEKGFSTRNYNYHGCFGTQKLVAVVNKEFPNTSFFELKKEVKPEPVEKVQEEKKSNVECSELSNTKCKKSDNCELVTKKIKGKSNNKKNKVKKCLPKKIGGKRTKRKKSRKKRKKSRKRSR